MIISDEPGLYMKSLYAEKTFVFETSWTEAVAEEEKANGLFSAKENALFLRLKEECSYAVKFYQSHDSLLINPSYRTEESFTLVSPENPLVSFKGQFDKIVSFGKGKRYFAVIDYKTGGERFNEKLLPYGLSMQLPYYAYYAMHERSSNHVSPISNPLKRPRGRFAPRRGLPLSMFCRCGRLFLYASGTVADHRSYADQSGSAHPLPSF